MQYIPVSFDTQSYTDSAFDFSAQENQTSSFSGVLEKTVRQNEQTVGTADNTKDGKKFDADGDFDAEDSSVYSSRAEIYSFFVPQEPRFNQEELTQLAKAFQNDNICIEAQNALADIMNKPEGPTLKELLAALAQSTKGGNADLTANEISYLQNLAGRANPDQPSLLYDSIRYRDGLTGMKALISSLKQNPTTMSMEELSALSKAFGLPEDVQKGMQELLSSFDKNKVLSSEQVDSLFKEAKALMESRNENFNAMQKSLEQNIKPLLDSAKDREAQERRDLMRENREVLYSKALIEDTVITKAVGEELNRTTVNGEKLGEEDGSKANTAGTDSIKQNAAEKSLPQGAADKQDTEIVTARQVSLLTAVKVQNERESTLKAENKLFEASQEEKLQSEEQSERFGSAGQANESRQDFSRGREEEFSRQSFAQASYEERVLASLAGLQGVQTAAGFDVNTANFAGNAADVRSQVQDSVLTMMKNGAKRLEVSLNPVELGQMAVMLTMKDGEVNAVIQTEKAESASLINQQVEVIRQGLENQGFKVQNIEVEVGLSNYSDSNGGQSWESMQQHNNEQTFRENLQNLNYLRALSRKGSTEDATLAHNMQNIGSIVTGRENNSPQGIHIIT